MVYGKFPDGQIDHINQDKKDNRLCNLREVSHSDNQKNRPMYKRNTSGVVGVYWCKLNQKWKASIRVNSVQIHLGLFETIEDAAVARKNAEKLYGFHKNHGGVSHAL